MPSAVSASAGALREPVRAAAVACALVFLLSFAYAPLLRAGLLARDGEVLARASATLAASPGAALAAEDGPRPLAALSLALSARLFAALGADGGGALLLRVQQLVLLLGAALALGLLTHRLLLPWLGGDKAVAAARAAAALLALHPLAVTAVASLEAHGELLGLLLALASSALFLQGRQDGRVGRTAAGFVLCAAGGFASDLVLVLPLFFAGFEFLSSQRHRSLRRRLRTSLTTLVLFGVAASLETLFRSVHAAGAAPPRPLAGLAAVDGAADWARIAAEKLGLLILPANPGVLGIGGPVVAGAVFLLAMQPALVAARSAPRLWGWMLAAWFLALFATELVHPGVRVRAQDLDLAHVLLPSAAVMAVGLGIASTALSGPRHPYIAWGVALVYAILAFAGGRPWTRAADEAAELRAALAAAHAELGPDTTLLVVDPPRARAGVDPVGDALPWLLVGDDLRALPDVRGIRREALRLLLRQPELDELRAGGLGLVLPADAFPGAAGSGRVARALPSPRASSGPRSWSGLRSPPLDLEPQREVALRAVAREGGVPGALGPVRWSTPGARTPPELAPVWLRGPDGLVAHYDLASSFDWLLAGRVRLLWFEEGTLATENQLVARIPAFASEVTPRPAGRDWSFARPDTGGLAPVEGSARLRLVLLDLAQLASEVLPLERRGERLVAAGAAAFVARAQGPVVWALEWLVEDAVVLRAEGRPGE